MTPVSPLQHAHSPLAPHFLFPLLPDLSTAIRGTILSLLLADTLLFELNVSLFASVLAVGVNDLFDLEP